MNPFPEYMTRDREWQRLRAKFLRLTSAIKAAEKSGQIKTAMNLLRKKQWVSTELARLEQVLGSIEGAKANG